MSIADLLYNILSLIGALGLFIFGMKVMSEAVQKFAGGRMRRTLRAMVNPCIILGPGTWNDGSAAIFKNIANGFKFYTKGINAYVDVRDVVEAIVILSESDKCERYVIAAENKSYQWIFTQIANGLGVAPPSVEVKPWMSALAWRWEALKTKISGSRPLLTKETARTALGAYYYQNEKARNELGIEFRNLDESIEFISACYRKDFPA